MWNMDECRWSILVRQLAQVKRDRRISIKEAEIIMGKLNYYSALVPRGVRYRSLFGVWEVVDVAVAYWGSG